MKFLSIFDNTRFQKCSYQTLKQVCDRNGTQLAKTYYIIDWFAIIYATIRLLLVAFMVNNKFKVNPNIPYIIERDDPFMTFMKTHSEMYDEAFILIFLLMGIFNFVCQTRLYKLNTCRRVWQLWYQVLITNHDNYYRFMKPDYHRTIINRKTNEIVKNFHQNNFINRIVPEFIIHLYAMFHSRLLSQFNFEHIDEKKFFAKNLIHLPNLSKKLKIHLMNLMILGDYMWFGLQLLVGKQYKLKLIFAINLY